MYNYWIEVFYSLNQYLQTIVWKIVSAEIDLSKMFAIFQNFRNNIKTSITKTTVTQVELSVALNFVVFLDNFEKSDHLLFTGINLQVLAFGNIKLHQQLFAETFNFWHAFQVVHKLGDINLCNLLWRLLLVSSVAIRVTAFVPVQRGTMNPKFFICRERVELIYILILVYISIRFHLSRRSCEHWTETVATVYSIQSVIDWSDIRAWVWLIGFVFINKRRLVPCKRDHLFCFGTVFIFLLHRDARHNCPFGVHVYCAKLTVIIRYSSFSR